ncbi:MAG: hypothetical protein K5912_02990 [Alphaproteobacteria bacterium]|nr:hypothetical protein [Alphaproteobacteria bacterium]
MSPIFISKSSAYQYKQPAFYKIKNNPKKDTFFVRIDGFADVNYADFSALAVTPLVVTNKNNESVQFDSHYFATTLFPNPFANKMAMNFEENRKKLGQLANIILEYKSKLNENYVLTVFPDGSYFCQNGDLKSTLALLDEMNAADAMQQIEKRKKLMDYSK